MGSQGISEADTPKVSVFPSIGGNLAPQESARGSVPESEEGYARSESSVEDALNEVKKQLNTIAQQMHAAPEDCAEEQPRPESQSKVNVSTKGDEYKTRCSEIIERTLKVLAEYKDAIRLLHEFPENLVKIEDEQGISQKERQIKRRFLTSYMQQAAQKYPVKAIEDEIEFLKAARLIYDKESVATSATYTVVEASQSEARRKEGKYQMLIEKAKKENSLLKNIVNEIEASAKGIVTESCGKANNKQFGLKVDAAMQTEKEASVQKKQMLETLSKLAKARRQEESEDIKDRLKEILEGITMLSAKGLNVQGGRLLTASNVFDVSIGTDKNEHRMSALASILLCRFSSLASEMSLNTFRRSSEAMPRQGDSISALKNVTRSLLNILSGSLKVEFMAKGSMEMTRQGT